MFLKGPEDLRRYVFGKFGVPMLFIPFLQYSNLPTSDLHVKLYVVVKTRMGKIGRSYKRGRPHNFQPGMGNISFCVKLFLTIDLALNLAHP